MYGECTKVQDYFDSGNLDLHFTCSCVEVERICLSKAQMEVNFT